MQDLADISQQIVVLSAFTELYERAFVAQWVWWFGYRLKVEGALFDSQRDLMTSLIQNIQTGFDTRSASYPKGNECNFSGDKARRGVKLTSQIQLAKRLKILELYLHSTTYLMSEERN